MTRIKGKEPDFESLTSTLTTLSLSCLHFKCSALFTEIDNIFQRMKKAIKTEKYCSPRTHKVVSEAFYPKCQI